MQAHYDTPRSAPTRRRFVKGLAGVAAAGGTLSAACSLRPEGESTPSLTQKPITVRFFLGGVNAQFTTRWDSEIASAYKERRPNVTIDLIPQESEIGGISGGSTTNVVQKLVTLIAGGDPPDINELPRTAMWQTGQGLLSDEVDAFVKRDKYDVKQFSPKEFERTAMHEGKIWQIPFKYGGLALVMVCNRSLFQAAGVPLPSTDPSRTWDWNAFVEAGNKLTRRTDGQISQFGLMNYSTPYSTWPPLWETNWITDAWSPNPDKKIICDNPDMQDCYTKFADLFHRHHLVPQPNEAQQLFGSGNLFFLGKAAIAITAPNNLLSTYFGSNGLAETVAVPLPRVKASVPDVNTHKLGIIRGSKLPADSWDLIKFFNEGSRLARASDRIPAVLKDIEPTVRERLQPFPHVDAKVVLRALENHPPQIGLGNLRNGDEMLGVINPAMNDLVAGKEAPVPLLTRLKPTLQAIYDKR